MALYTRMFQYVGIDETVWLSVSFSWEITLTDASLEWHLDNRQYVLRDNDTATNLD